MGFDPLRDLPALPGARRLQFFDPASKCDTGILAVVKLGKDKPIDGKFSVEGTLGAAPAPISISLTFSAFGRTQGDWTVSDCTALMDSQRYRFNKLFVFHIAQLLLLLFIEISSSLYLK